MLEPADRELFLAGLSPPTGFELDRVLGTTYTLDLHALLSVPLALTFANCESADGAPVSDPLAVLESLRRLTKRMAVYTQAGGIALPRVDQRLYAFLEDAVIDVAAPNEGAIFHPKVWILRFTAPAEPVLYRVLVLTRNLTYDRSWDGMVVLEGCVESRRRTDPDTQPLADFVAALPALAVAPVAAYHREMAELMASEVSSVGFALPDGVEEISFIPLGLGGPGLDLEKEDIRRLLVMSPFVSDALLAGLLKSETSDILITRADQAVALKPATVEGIELLALHEQACPEAEDPIDGETPSTASSLDGLHAKVLIADAGWKSRVWLGSANATTAGHTANVEFVVKLVGPKSKLGIDAFLGDGSGRGFRGLLSEIPATSCTGETPGSAEAERRLAAWQRLLACIPMSLIASEGPDGEFGLTLNVPSMPSELADSRCRAQCWLSSVASFRAVDLPLLTASQSLALPSVSLTGLSAFLVLELTPPPEDTVGPITFAIRVELSGTPSDRSEQLLRGLLSNRGDVLRYLYLLLAGPDAPLAALVGAGNAHGPGSPVSAFEPAALFEKLLRVLVRQPKELERVAHLIEDLRADPASSEMLPSDLLPVWDAIWAAAGRGPA